MIQISGAKVRNDFLFSFPVIPINDTICTVAVAEVNRDPRGRTITVAYLAIVDEPVAVIGQDDAVKAEWWPLSDLPHLAFDHYDIIQDAIRKCRETFNPNFALTFGRK